MQNILKRSRLDYIEIAGLLLFLLILFFSCKHEIPQQPLVDPPVDGGTQTCSADTVYFQNKVLPLINSSCAMSGCHDAITHKEGVNLTSYANIIATGGVKPGNPSGSKLYTVLNKTGGDRMPPPPAAAFTQAQKDIIYKWILQGAKNNACNDCDTTVFTYNAGIAPIMNTYCKGCHNPSSLGGGIDLSAYAGVKATAVNGKLVGSITHASGYIAMPQGGNKLSDCRITQIKKWITAGSLNN
ncbi:MAG: c-type cytochrome [Ferruginibacter sp.]